MWVKSFGYLTAMWMLCFSHALIAAPDLTAGQRDSTPGASVSVPFDWVNDGSVVAQQFDLVFDASALNVTNVSAGAAGTGHTLDWQVVSAGRLRVVFSTPVMNAITSGNLVNVDIAVAPHAAVGEYPLIIDDPLFADDQARPVAPTSVLSGNVRVLGVLPPSDPAVAIPVLGWFSVLLLIGILAGLGWLAIRRGIGSVMMSVFLGGILFSSTLVQAATLPGDANNDGDVNALDIPVIVAQILERATAPGNPDCNQDSLVNVLDTVCAARPPAENQAPLLAAIADQQTVVGQNFSLTAVATDPDSGDVVTYSLDQAPAGMTIAAASGLIAWTPTISQLGINNVTVRATDQDALFDTEAFQINVVEIANNRAPTLIPPGNRQIQVNRSFSTSLFATDPDAGDVLEFALTGSPAGMSVHPATGLLSWSPDSSQLGINAVTATVTDAGGLTDSKSFNIEVTEVFLDQTVNAPPKLTVPGDQSMTLANLLSVAASATDADGDSLVFELVNAPTGMSIDSVNGAISWTPTAAQIGAYDVAVKVSDTHGAADFGSFIVTVVHVNRPPVATDDVYQVRIGDSLSVAAPGVLGNDSDPDNDPLTGSLVSDVAKGSLDFRTDGSFDYTPDKPTGNAKVELEVQCEIGKEASGDYRHRGTLAVGDVDNDGEIEIVGVGGATPRIFMYTVWIISASDCSPKLISSDEVYKGGGAELYSHPGLLDINGDGNLEIIVPRNRFPLAEGGEYDHQHLMAIRHDGTLAWPGNGGSATSAYSRSTADYLHSGPTFADLDGDGTVEILMTGKIPGTLHRSSRHVLTVYNSVDGSIKWEHVGEDYFERADAQPPVVADLDLDGKMEVILHTSVIDHEGNTKFLLPAELLDSQPRHLYSAVANFDSDPYPEIVARDRGHIYLFKHDGSLIWKKVNPNRSTNQIAVADFDGDGEVEFAYSHGISIPDGFLVVYDNDGSVLWSHENIPELKLIHLNHAENITAFDANGDGAVDIIIHTVDSSGVYGTYIFDGRDGSILHFEPASRLSTEQRFLTVADIDGDGEAELIYSSPDGYGGGFTRVWQGTAANPLPPAPPLSTQWAFNQTMFRDDATIISNPTPAWLQPGHNGYHLISSRGEFNLAATTDSFTYKASDGALESNLATVNFDVQPNGVAPMFLSEPDTLTTVGFQYEYAPRVIDYDPGDTVSFMLTEAPNGMTIDPVTGVVRWLPDTNGSYPVIILAYDTIGFATPQAYTLMVGDPVTVPDVIGQPEASAETSLTNANLITGQISRANHPTIAAGSVFGQTPPGGAVAQFGAAVDLSISTGPGPGDIDSDGDGFTPNEGDCNDNDASIYPGANDPEGDGIDQDCDGIDGSQAISDIVIEPDAITLLAGESATLSAFAIFDDGSAQPVTSVASWSSSSDSVAAVAATGKVSAVSGGTTTINAILNSSSGQANVTIVPRNLSDKVPPVAIISSPMEDELITEVVNIMGTASDAELVRYRLDLALVGDSHFTLIKESTASVTNGVLGLLDATRLLNGLYTLRLKVLDAGGNESIAETIVQIDGLLKVGQFSMSFTDASLPATGLPLDLVRTYDSRNRSKGDFGMGWELSFQGISLDCVNPLGDGWTVVKAGLSYQLTQSRSHTCVVKIPGQRAEVFDFVPNHTVSPIVPFSFLSGSFKPRPATKGQLLNTEGNNFAIIEDQPGAVKLFNDDDFSLFAPNHFLYTRPDGMSLVFVGGKVQSITDLAGNSITFGADGFSHSSGRGFAFERDDLDRILKVTDPQGNSQQYAYSAAGDLVSHIDAMGNVSRFFYNQHHGLLRIEDPLNRPVLRNDYDDDGRLISTMEPDGRTITFDYSSGGKTQTITDADGAVTIVSADALGNVTATLDALGGEELQTFDSEGNLLSRTDENGHTTIYTYDARGNKLTETNALGNTWSYAYDSRGNVTAATNELGHTTTYTYSASGLPVSRTNALGMVDQTMSYDGKGNLIARTDALGNTKVFSYNSFGDPTSVTDARGNQATYAYNANGALLSMTDKQGKTTSFTRNANGEKLTETDPLGRTTQFQYDAAGQLIKVVDPLGAAIENQYDSKGNLIVSLNPLGETTTFEFSQTGNLTRTVGPGTLESVYGYDVLGRRILVQTPGGQNLTVEYDAAGNVIRQEDAIGNAYQTSFGADNRPATMIGPDGTMVQKVYDAAGNLTRQTNARGNPTDFEYDAMNRPVRTVFADGSSISQTFDAANNIIQKIDAAGNITTYDYDANNNLLSVTEPMGAETRFEYDANDRRVAIEDARGNRTTMQYDATGRMVRRIYPDGTMEQLHYDAAGRVSSRIDPDGSSTQFDYDVKGRLIRKTYADASFDTFVWSADEQLIEASNAEGTVEYQYNSDGLLSAILNPDGSSIAYSYNAVGAIASITTRTWLAATARTTQLGYDGFGRLVRVEDADGAITAYTFDAMSNLVSASFANGTQSDYQYDDLDRLVQVTHSNAGGSIEQYTYTLDALGNRTKMTTQDGAYIEYAYDARRRLIRESHFDLSAVKQFEASYQYDAVGNRTRTVDLAGQETHYTYNSADQLLTRGSETFTYGPGGNLLTRTQGTDTTAYEFDVRNRLVKVAQPAAMVSYGYDARGERVRRSVNGVDTHYLVGIAPYSQPSQVLVEYDSFDNAVAENVFAGKHLVSRQQSGLTSNAHMDASLNVRLLTNASGSVSDRYEYDAFGNVLSHTGTSNNPYQFAGERLDEPENLTYLRARYYDPKAGRFISRDPFKGFAEQPFSLHRYQYADQNPLLYSDPTGEYTLKGVMASVSIIGIVAGIGVNYLTDIKSSAKELKGLTNQFRAKFCRGALLGEGAALAAQPVLIAENEAGLRPGGPTSAEYFVAAFGAGFGVGTLGGNRSEEQTFEAPGSRSVTQFGGTGKLLLGGVSVGLSGYGGAGATGELHWLPEGSKISVSGAGLSGSALGTSGATAVHMTTLWMLQGKNKFLGFTGKLECHRAGRG